MKRLQGFLLLGPLLVLGGLALTAAAERAGGGTAPRETAPRATASPEAPAGFTLAGDARRGAALFGEHCGTCHGAGGRGDGLLSPHLEPPPGDLSSEERMGARSDWHLYRVIRDGGRAVKLSPVMPAFGEQLTEQELHDLATFTRGLARPAGR